jgi:adenine/guanine phosphoribosyltransferase-like PRPP-binding protein
MNNHKPEIRCAEHLAEMLVPETAELAVSRAIKLLKSLLHGVKGEQPLDFDAIACSGISGLLFAPPVAKALGKTLLIVRKQKGEHSYQLVEGDHGAKRYIVLDDLICSGATLDRIVSRIEVVNKAARCQGFLGYARLLNDMPKRRREAWRSLDELESRHYSSTLCRQTADDRSAKVIVKPAPLVIPIAKAMAAHV